MREQEFRAGSRTGLITCRNGRNQEIRERLPLVITCPQSDNSNPRTRRRDTKHAFEWIRQRWKEITEEFGCLSGSRQSQGNRRNPNRCAVKIRYIECHGGG